MKYELKVKLLNVGNVTETGVIIFFVYAQTKYMYLEWLKFTHMNRRENFI